MAVTGLSSTIGGEVALQQAMDCYDCSQADGGSETYGHQCTRKTGLGCVKSLKCQTHRLGLNWSA